MFEPGTILRHSCAYQDQLTGIFRPKYILILAQTKRSHDLVWRLLTSRQHGRPERPACYHGDPYPGFYLGVLAPEKGLGTKSWLDLRFFPDGDVEQAKQDAKSGLLHTICTILPLCFGKQRYALPAPMTHPQFKSQPFVIFSVVNGKNRLNDQVALDSIPPR